MKQIFVDIETTGLESNKCDITEIAMIAVKNGKTQGKLYTKGNNLYHDTIEFLKKYIDPYDKNDKAYFLAWNAGFDSEFMHKFMSGKKLQFGNFFYHIPVDVLQYAVFRYMRKGIVPFDFKLVTVAKNLGIKVQEDKLHSADYDIEITRKIYLKLLKK